MNVQEIQTTEAKQITMAGFNCPNVVSSSFYAELKYYIPEIVGYTRPTNENSVVEGTI